MKRLPPALVPLQHTDYRRLWLASLVASLGLWLQNTGAGWLMTSLAPVPLVVAMVQVATILPTFLLALPGGALADIVDRRRFLLGTQTWTTLVAALLAGLTLAHQTTAWSLLVLTFCIGIGGALTAPAWSAVIPDLVPREDLVQAIALGGIGFNLARAIGPAVAGVLVLIGGAGLAFALYAASFTAIIAALWVWRSERREQSVALPREHLLSAMRAGARFVRSTPPIRAAMVRCFAFALPASAPWALLPLVVRQQLGLGPGMFGLILGLMGAGGVASGLLMPALAQRMSRGTMVFVATLASCAGMALVGLARHWTEAALGMALFGTGWVAAFAMTQAAAQLACPPWVRARALAIYQLSFNGALTLGSIAWGWLGNRIGLSEALLASAALGVAMAMPVRIFGLDAAQAATQPATRAETEPAGEAPMKPPEAPVAQSAPVLAPALAQARERVMETKRYTVGLEERQLFLAAMAEVRLVRRRAGAVSWRLYEDVSHPNTFLETWAMESWTDHLRENSRQSAEDRAAVARAETFHAEGQPPAERFISVNPTHGLATAPAQQPVIRWRTAAQTPYRTRTGQGIAS